MTGMKAARSIVVACLVAGASAITADAQGDVYTTEVNTGQRVQKFRRVR